MKFLKVRLEKVDRTDLFCVACGGFRAEYAIVTGHEAGPHAGVHKKCVAKVKVKRGTAA